MFRHQPVGKHIVHVCHGTACHVGGAERVEDALRRHLRIPEGSDTDAERRFTIERVACLGCCTLAPVVRIDEETFGYATAEKVPGAIRDFLASRQTRRRRQASRQRAHAGQRRRRDQGLPRLVLHGQGNGPRLPGLAAEPGAERRERHGETRRLRRRLLSHADGRGRRAGQAERDLRGLTLAQAGELVQRHFRPRGLARRMSQLWTRVLDGLLVDDGSGRARAGALAVDQA